MASTTSNPPEDTLFYYLYPDPSKTTLSSLTTLHLSILSTLTPLLSPYLFHHHPPTLTLSLSPLPHLTGRLRFGPSILDEWFLVHLLLHLSSLFPSLSISLLDSDGDFLLIESAFHLPRWLSPSTSPNRVFIRNHKICIIPISAFPTTPTLSQALHYLSTTPVEEYVASSAIQNTILRKTNQFPELGVKNIHLCRARVSVSVAQVLRHEPGLVGLAVEGFYDRDIDGMRVIGEKMERFVPFGRGEELVEVAVRMTRAMYAQLVQQTFQAPRCYPGRGDGEGFREAELGMKIACGFEMMYQLRKREGGEGTKGSTWEVFRRSMERNGYFQGLLTGSEEYKRLLKNVENYYRESSVFSKAR